MGGVAGAKRFGGATHAQGADPPVWGEGSGQELEAPQENQRGSEKQQLYSWWMPAWTKGVLGPYRAPPSAEVRNPHPPGFWSLDYKVTEVCSKAEL